MNSIKFVGTEEFLNNNIEPKNSVLLNGYKTYKFDLCRRGYWMHSQNLKGYTLAYLDLLKHFLGSVKMKTLYPFWRIRALATPEGCCPQFSDISPRLIVKRWEELVDSWRQ